jgi:hypothetical protein
VAEMKRWALAATLCATSIVTADAAFAQCPGRPTDPGGVVGFDYDGDTSAQYDTPEGRVRVHFTEDGAHAPDLETTPPNDDPDFVVLVGQVAEESLDGYEALGFRAPVSDVADSCDSDGGDDRLDIYLVDFGAGDGQVVAGPCSGVGAARTCAAFALVDHRLAGYPSDTVAARTVVGHEVFHVLQNAYVTDLAAWFSEGSAQWAADHLHPELDDLEAFIPAFFEETDRSIDNPPGGAAGAFLYGSAIWPVFLEQRHDTDVVRSILEAGPAGDAIWPAHDAALATRDSSMAATFPEFAAWNGATGSRAGSFGYADAADYPEVAVESLAGALPLTYEGATSGFASRYVHVDVGATTARASLDTDPERNAGVVLRLTNGRAEEGAALPMPATFEGEALLIVAGVSPRKPDGPFTLTVEVATDEGAGGSTSSTASASGATAATSTSATSSSGPGGGGVGGSDAGDGDDDAAEDDGGCSCGMPGASERPLGGALALVAASLWAARRRAPRAIRRSSS